MKFSLVEIFAACLKSLLSESPPKRPQAAPFLADPGNSELHLLSESVDEEQKLTEDFSRVCISEPTYSTLDGSLTMLFGEDIPSNHPEPRVDVNHDPEGDKNIRIDKVDRFKWLDELTNQKTIDWAEADANMNRSQAFRRPDMLAQGLMPDTVDLYMLLERRAYTKLFPGAWPRDNPSFFEHNFNGGADAALRGIGKPDHHAEFAFRDLLKMAGKARSVRAQPTCHVRRSEALMAQHIRQYIRWSHRDANLIEPIREERLVPLLSVIAGYRGGVIEQLEQRTLRILRKKSQRVLDLIRNPEVTERAEFGRDESYIVSPPTVWGIVVLQEVLAIVAYQPLSGGRDKLLPIAFFHLRNARYTEWNTAAIALLVVYCRDRLLEMATALGVYSAAAPALC